MVHASRFLGAALVPLALAACGTSTTTTNNTPTAIPTCVGGSITASGSTALQPLVQKASEQYIAQCNKAVINVSGGGSSVGLANVAAGTSDIGNSDVPISNAKNIDASAVTDHEVAIVVFAIAVNTDTGISNLTTAQVRDIFSGNVTNWKQVGGNDLPVTLIERKPGSGTRLSFDKIMMNGRTESATPATTQDSTQLVLQQVAATSPGGGVSYVAVSSINNNPNVIAVPLDGARPNATDVAAGKYPLFSHEHMYTKKSPNQLVGSFIQFILSSNFQNTLTQLGYLPLSTTSQQSAADR